MKFWTKNLRKQEPTDAVEVALLKSLREEPTHWNITEMQNYVIRARHNELGLVVDVDQDGAHSGKLMFSKEFTNLWSPMILSEKRRREAESDAARAAEARAEFARRLKV